MRRARPTKVYCDGGARPNPGPIEVAVVASGQTQLFDDLGHGSSSEAEWHALIAALGVARDLGLSEFDLLGDNRHVIDRASDLLKDTRRASQTLEKRFVALAAKRPPRRLRWIPRQQNLAGIALDARHHR